MSLRLASRRLLPPGSQFSASTTTVKSSLPVTGGTAVQRRSKWSLFQGWGKKSEKEEAFAGLNLDDPKTRQQFLDRNMNGRIENNIFQDELETAAAKDAKDAARKRPENVEQKTRENMAMVVDPDPLGRMRWQRRKVMQMVRKNGRMTKDQKIKMTERQLVHKSPFMATSVKKLMLLARQISGKSVDDAITQMTWSKKKMAAEIRYYLEEARDLAIAQRGMGLGRVNGELYDNPKKIQTREGKWVEVVDPSRMYIAQSWVGRGKWRGKSIDAKGRGRMGLIQHPATCE
ncbi:mitochondrial large ribosomal subunit [Cordyceps fumosorosea ARSEF 2679]|uniref:Mitochondrial large ribosomal subunit n=1 Tax=Cordyceps fumosorosea (strain ARSEF 2679) TaxID=1081104 RepID=A0A167LF74_CORFA|nr:mitochondrial large ribosomal subunit [Cordyceps fumosorosea ARSEF 2679]OAA53017.1 mitochondrial large ribosomal subunit [Cordyceps fumosorosea ARSEF 2679]